MGLSFEKAAAGGGGASGFADWKTVGSSGADYATVTAAQAAGFYRVVLITDVTETTDVPVDANGLMINLNDYHLDMATNNVQFLASAASQIAVWSWTDSGKISMNFASAKNLFEPTATYDQDSELYLTNVHFEILSSVTSTFVWNSGYGKVRAKDIKVTVANQLLSGVKLNDNAEIDGIELIGGGTTSRIGITIDGAAKVSRIYISGTWSSFATQIDTNSGDAIIDGITMAASGELIVAGSVTDIRELSGSTDITIGVNDSDLKGVYVTGDLDLAGFDFCTFNGFQFAALSAAVTSAQCIFGEGEFTGAVSFAGDSPQVNNVRFNDTLTLASTVDEARFGDSNVYKGNVVIDGTKNSLKGFCDTGVTVTINSGAQYNDVDVTIDQAVTDNSGNATNAISELIY